MKLAGTTASELRSYLTIKEHEEGLCFIKIPNNEAKKALYELSNTSSSL